MLKPTHYKYRRLLPVACAILDLSKLLMMKYYYNVLKKVYDPNPLAPLKDQTCRLTYTDTDSFIIETKTPLEYKNIYKYFILPNYQHHDLSVYPKDHIIWEGLNDTEIKFYQNYNKGAVGKMKDEAAEVDEYVLEICAVRSKCYSFKIGNNIMIMKKFKLKAEVKA